MSRAGPPGPAASPVAAAPGRWAEQRARSELEALGWSTLEANARARGGELDLVMDDHGTVVFVEVRHRTRSAVGDSADSIGFHKRARLRRAAALWLARRGRSETYVRFDVVLFDGPPGRARRRHLRNAF